MQHRQLPGDGGRREEREVSHHTTRVGKEDKQWFIHLLASRSLATPSILMSIYGSVSLSRRDRV